MRAIEPHGRFDLEELRRLQGTLAQSVRLEPLQRQPETAAGVDAAYVGEEIVAVAVLFDLATLTPVERSFVVARTALPYIPGFLSFREGPHLAEAVRRLSKRPGLLIVDGQGIAHPKRFGLACYLGVELGVPAIGCAKSRLVGEYVEPAAERGSRTPLLDRKETVRPQDPQQRKTGLRLSGPSHHQRRSSGACAPDHGGLPPPRTPAGSRPLCGRDQAETPVRGSSCNCRKQSLSLPVALDRPLAVTANGHVLRFSLKRLYLAGSGASKLSEPMIATG
jgi:deoxyribonuclease V